VRHLRAPVLGARLIRLGPEAVLHFEQRNHGAFFIYAVFSRSRFLRLQDAPGQSYRRRSTGEPDAARNGVAPC
jgi:hypothetical protein